jgi:transcription elongation GreA/GreB family factor
MSRAFVKEDDGQALDDPPPRPPRVQPCYITRRGFMALRDELETAQANLIRAAAGASLSEQAAKTVLSRRIHEISQILQDAVPVDVTPEQGNVARFGATVEVVDEDGQEARYTIVGEDEVAPEQGRISWVSPLGRALIGHRVGEDVEWQRPDGARRLDIVSVRFED